MEDIKKNLREGSWRASSWKNIVKGTSIIIVAPAMILLILVFWGTLEPLPALYAFIGIFIISILFVRPYIANISALTNYVLDLSLDKDAPAPDLTFLSNVDELSEAVGKLHKSWDIRRNQLEANVAESRILIDSLPDILIMLDRDYNLIRTNSTAKATFGGKFFEENLHKIVEDERVKETALHVLSDKKGRDMEFFMGNPFNRHYILRINRFPIYSPGGIALILVLHDITERKNTEQLLADFVANASHEIRTPLTSIAGLIETMQTVGKDDEKMRMEFLEVMRAQAERMSQLVKDLLSLSQIEKNMHTKPTGLANITKIIEEVVHGVTDAAKEKNMKLEVVKGENIPTITADMNEINQVLNNLISNAIKYGYEKTEIVIKIEEVENKWPEEKILREFDKIILVSVKNSGDGIDKKDIPRLTERFYRADTARSQKIKGTGLGLAIVKHIIDRHSGVLKIESALGEKTTFTVLLPVS